MRWLLLAAILISALFFQQPGSNGEAGTIPPRARILVIGDSLASGLYADDERATYASQVAEQLGGMLARRHASTLVQAGPLWDEVKVWRPSMIILEIGLNDVSSGQWAKGKWIEDYRGLVERIQATGATVVVCTAFWAGILPSHRNYAAYEGLNADVRQVASETGARLADLWNASQGCDECVSQKDELSYFAPYHGDGFHPNDYGHRLIARAIVQAIDGNRELFLPILQGN